MDVPTANLDPLLPFPISPVRAVKRLIPLTQGDL